MKRRELLYHPFGFGSSVAQCDFDLKISVNNAALINMLLALHYFSQKRKLD